MDAQTELKVLEPYKDRPDAAFPVIEIFGPTIQGEGGMIGVKTAFIRFGGCDYKCVKCDSMHAVLPEAVKANATWMTVEQIAHKLLDIREVHGCNWVTLSGGNPAMWDLQLLVDLLHELDWKIAVETQGSLWRDWLGEVDHLTICPKGPGMGERFNTSQFGAFLGKVEENYNRMMGRLAVTIKSVVFSQQDFEFAAELDGILDIRNSERGALLWPRDHRFLSLGNPHPPALLPNLKLDETYPDLPQELLKQYAILLEDYLQDDRLSHWKFLPQLHVLIWANKGGV